MSFQLPKLGFVYWPVANGDSTTIVIDSKTHLQVDLNHLEKSEDEDDPTWPIVDELVDRLQKKGGRPYLAAFALSHPDEDHCRGFTELLDEVDIGELWFTPRVFHEYTRDLCDDAKTFKREAERRVKKTIDVKGDPGAGHRVRIFGYSDLLEKGEYKDFPEDRLTIPGNELTTIDEEDVCGKFRAFVHAPFKDDSAGDRNDTSLGMQVTLSDGNKELQALLLGDLSYPIIKRIFDVSEPNDLSWNVLLAPHHCSKAVMYWKDEGDGEEKLKQHIVDEMEVASKSPNRIVSSSNTVPSSNKSGDNPPHVKAKTQYESITTSFLCTMDNDGPIVAELEDEVISFTGTATDASTATAAASRARGSNTTPGDAVTYGQGPC